MSKNCPFCVQGSLEYVFTNIDYISDKAFKIEKCPHCHVGITEFPAEDFDLSFYYPKEYYGKASIRFNSVIEFLIGLSRLSRARKINSLMKGKTGKVLDIGCGRGHMLSELRKNGWDVEGIEFSDQSSVYARKVLNLPVRICSDMDYSKYPDNNFDVVTLWHCLEHIQGSRALLTTLQRILKKNGLLIIEVPLFSSWQAKLSGGKWFHLDAPRHFYHFSTKSLLKTLESNNFKVCKLSTFSLEYGPFGMIQSLLNIFSSQPNFLFSILKNKHANHLAKNGKLFFWDIFINCVLFIPVFVFGTFLELASALMNKGGVIRVASRKQ